MVSRPLENLYTWYDLNKNIIEKDKLKGKKIMKPVDLEKNDTILNKYNFAYYKECPICTSKNIKDKYKVTGFTISECSECSVLFVREMLTMDFLKDCYQKSEGVAYEDDNQKCLGYYYHKIKSEIEKIKPNKGAILDIGCSSGFFLNRMEGWERHGIEISEEFGCKARGRIGDTVFIGPFEEYSVKENYFDVIALQDVFDHFVNPYGNLKKCYDMLKPGGVLVIKVHNISCLYAKITGANFYAIIPPQHLLYFNEKSLKYILNKVGFKFLKSRFIGHVLQLKTVFYRLSSGRPNTVSYKLYKLLKNNKFGKIELYKNLHDIITVFAVKKEKRLEK